MAVLLSLQIRWVVLLRGDCVALKVKKWCVKSDACRAWFCSTYPSAVIDKIRGITRKVTVKLTPLGPTVEREQLTGEYEITYHYPEDYKFEYPAGKWHTAPEKWTCSTCCANPLGVNSAKCNSWKAGIKAVENSRDFVKDIPASIPDLPDVPDIDPKKIFSEFIVKKESDLPAINKNEWPERSLYVPALLKSGAASAVCVQQGGTVEIGPVDNMTNYDALAGKYGKQILEKLNIGPLWRVAFRRNPKTYKYTYNDKVFYEKNGLCRTTCLNEDGSQSVACAGWRESVRKARDAEIEFEKTTGIDIDIGGKDTEPTDIEYDEHGCNKATHKWCEAQSRCITKQSDCVIIDGSGVGGTTNQLDISNLTATNPFKGNVVSNVTTEVPKNKMAIAGLVGGGLLIAGVAAVLIFMGMKK